jgi:hypothetical protein
MARRQGDRHSGGLLHEGTQPNLGSDGPRRARDNSLTASAGKMAGRLSSPESRSCDGATMARGYENPSDDGGPKRPWWHVAIGLAIMVVVLIVLFAR